MQDLEEDSMLDKEDSELEERASRSPREKIMLGKGQKKAQKKGGKNGQSQKK
jgi:hypothetical protein